MVFKLDEEVFNKAVKKYTKKYGVTEEVARERLLSLGPKALNDVGSLVAGGWRAGYTKKSLARRVIKNRKKEKNRRKANRQQRKRQK